MPLIELSGIRRVYRTESLAVEALRGIDLTVREGNFVAIMGSSGSGKSTLMNILGCLDRPDAGSYRLDGENIAVQATVTRRHSIWTKISRNSRNTSKKE